MLNNGNPLLYAFTILAGMLIMIMTAVVEARMAGLAILTGICLFGSVLIVYMLRYPWRPAAVLLLMTPFQFILTRHFGIVSNMLTWVPISIFLMQMLERGIITSLVGTRIQKLIAIFILALCVSFLQSFQKEFEIKQLLRFGQKVTVLFIVAVFAKGLSEEESIRKLCWILVVGTSIIYLIMMASFFTGINIIPRGNEEKIRETIEQCGITGSTVGLIRFGGILGANRFAFCGILPFFLDIGLMMKSQRKDTKLGLTLCLIILGFGILGSGSRSGLLGVAFGLIMFMIIMRRTYMRHVKGPFCAIGIILILFFLYGNTEVIRYRLSPEGLALGTKRFISWSFGWQLFSGSPFLGIGAGGFVHEYLNSSISFLSGGDPHSAFIQLLSEGGLIATIPFLILLVSVLKSLLSKTGSEKLQEYQIWQAAFLSGFIGMLISCIFNTYQYDRVFWFGISFAVALSMRKRMMVDHKRVIGGAKNFPSS